ncbi:competence type IV pilus minor pilin ComGF [Bombilactobacillus bombi]|uniref:competence type IV pilus minor pilin ComGF n=1 Tax=Bombilactobacillus bombi TaxID=1303590 RepID=UPI0015E5B569|nr:competence type IV pilus minor pilin ComGF [Bombilactobacillus bombi]
MTLSAISLLLTTFRQNKNRLFYNDSNWNIAMLRLEKMTADSKLITADSQSVTFETGSNSKFPYKRYRLQIYRNMLRVTGIDGGHMPILIHQQHLKLVPTNQSVKIETTDLLSRKWEYYLDFQ